MIRGISLILFFGSHNFFRGNFFCICYIEPIANYKKAIGLSVNYIYETEREDTY